MASSLPCEEKDVQKREVQLSGLPSGCDEEYIKLYFEDSEHLGESIEIKHVHLDTAQNSAVIEPNDPDVVGLIIDKQPFEIDKASVTAEIFSPLTVEVFGPKTIICDRNEKKLKMFMKIEKRCGGGEIKEFTIIKPGTAVVKYTSEKVADRVARRKIIQFMDAELEVRLYHPKYYKSNTVLISGLPDEIDEEYLELFFEEDDRFRESIPVEVKLNENNHSALLTFNDVDDVVNFLELGPLEMEGQEINVKWSSNQDQIEIHHSEKPASCAVKAEGPNDVICRKRERYLMRYFKSEKRSGGGSIDSLEFIEDGTALITFKEEKYAERVCKKDHSKEGITVKLYKGTIPPSEVKSLPDETQTQHGEKSCNSCVKVRDIPKSVSRLILELYFENEKRSDGGKIENISEDVEDNSVKYVTFESPEVAERVAKRKHTIDGHNLPVKLYVQAPSHKTKVLVKRLPDGCSKDSLFFFLEAKSTTKPKSISYHNDLPDVALVTMESEIDFISLTKACAEFRFEGVHLELSRVPYSHIIWVGNLAENTTPLIVELYFESPKGGEGHVEKVVMNQSEGTCLVYFENYKDVDVVLKRKHRIENKEVLVKRYESCLQAPENDSSERTLKIPKPVKVPADSNKVDFLKKSDYRHVIEEELLKSQTKITWPNDKKDGVILECTLTKLDRDAFQLVREWETRAMETFDRCLKSVCVYEIPVLQDIWEKAIQVLKTIHISNPNKVCVITQKDQCLFKIVGETSSAGLLHQEITSSIDNVKKDLAKVKEVLKNLAPLEIQLLKRIQFDVYIRSSYSELSLCVDENQLILEGSSCSVRDAKVEILEKTKEFAYSSIDNISVSSKKLYESTATQRHVEEKFQRSQISVVWVIDKDQVDVCCSERKFLQQCIAILKESVKEHYIDISNLEIPDLTTQKWQSKIDEIACADPGKVIISLTPDYKQITVCATDEIIDEIVKQMNNYIQCNTLITESVDCEYDVLLLLQKHHMKDIEGNDDISVKIALDLNSECISVKCLRPMMINARRRVNEILSKVQFQQHTVSKPGIYEIMKQEKGQKHLQVIEATFPCRIVIDDQEDSSQNSCLVARCEYSNKRIDAVVCDITEKDVGIIINPDDEKLQFLGGLGSAIISKGGESIKQECLQHGGLKDYEVFVTKGGKLKCSYIFHIKSNEWKCGNNGETKYLEDVVLKCLLEADKRKNVDSVAIPAIGCGINGFPIEAATRSIADALQRFCLEKQDSAIKWIYLCDRDIVKVRGFASALCDVFGPKHVKVTMEDGYSALEDATLVHDLGAGHDGLSKRRAQRKLNAKPTGVLLQKTQIQIKIVKGDLASQTVDVMVNSTSKELNLTNGAVSQSILKKAGQSLQDEIKLMHPKGLDSCKVAVTGGHSLKCKAVLHTSISQFDQKNILQCKQNLKEIVCLCLGQTEKLQFSSVAFPAIGSGNLGYPHDIVAAEMFSAVEEYNRLHPQTCIREVSFVVYQLDAMTIVAFEKAYSRYLTNKTTPSHVSGTKVTPTTTQAQSSDSASVPSTNLPPGVFMIGSVAVTAKVGNLLQENIDCIVNGTNEQLNRGTIMTEILTKCGKTLAEELYHKKEEMTKQKIISSSAPRLPCKRIIYVVMPPQKHMSETIKKSLDLAESLGISSVGIPAMDIEHNQDIRHLAKQMVLGVKQFAKCSPKNVQEVRFVLYNPVYLGMFQSAVDEVSDSRSTIEKFFKPKETAVVKNKPRPPNEIQIKPVTFNIYSLSLGTIENVKKKIDACLMEEMETHDFNDQVIENLNDHQVLELQSMMRTCHVHVVIDQTNGTIKLAGIKDNVHTAALKVQTYLRDVSEMDWMVQLVQWYAILIGEDGEDVSDYPKNVNALLEKAYKRKERTVTYLNRDDGKKYVIDFEKMEETPEDDPTDVARVIRRDRIKGGFVCEIPLTWGDMTEKIKVVNLDKQSNEYTDIAARFSQSTGIYSCTVEKIERIQNRTLWEQYESKKKEMEEVNVGQTNERLLWHGTPESVVDSINLHGFNRSYCGRNATKFGEGVYFAVNAEYSCMEIYSKPDARGVRRVYYCRVLTGDYALGEEKMRVPPPNPTRGRHCIYNSVVDDLYNPDMFVIFHDSQAYPEYLIYFKR